MWTKKIGAFIIGLIMVTFLFTGVQQASAHSFTTTEVNTVFKDALERQIALKGQTDKKYDMYIRADALNVSGSTGTIKQGTNGQSTRWNLRGGPGTTFWIIGQVTSGEKVNITNTVQGNDGFTWYKIQLNKMWVNASPEDIEYYLNPNNFSNDSSHFYQFLDLSTGAGVQASELNKTVLASKGILTGQGQAFIEASKTHSINEIYLISHALLETGNGHSELARGINYNGQTVYNMYGIGAFDGCAKSCGAKYAYDQGWFTPEKAIIDGAKFVARNYIHNGQDSLYKMRWNPANPGHNQYATDIAWAIKQTGRIANLYSSISGHTLSYNIPVYKEQPGTPPEYVHTGNPEPTEITRYPEGIIGTTTTRVNFRNEPNTTAQSFIRTLDTQTRVQVLGINFNGWYEVKIGRATGWVSGEYVSLQNLYQISTSSTSLNVRAQPNGEIIDSVKKDEYITGVLQKNGQVHTNNSWTQVDYNKRTSWVSSDFLKKVGQ
ncbi:SH3 domain-containing protein [Alkalihalobacillus sp. 1P02AB]|uniref:SH3 domain-containing protein n=1 Tax=Alkalihalobacillus sp. 1P02AB TaxID=3132260 RepID=UPI0039A739B2